MSRKVFYGSDTFGIKDYRFFQMNSLSFNEASYVAEYRVLYGDTDTMGQAYYANYLKWFEIGRAELFRKGGFSYREVEEKGIYLPVIEAFCKYHEPAVYDDIILIASKFTLERRIRLRFDYEIYKKNNLTSLVATGYTIHVCLNRQKRPVRPPAFLLEGLQRASEE